MESWNRIPKDGWMDGWCFELCLLDEDENIPELCVFHLFVCFICGLGFSNVKCVFWECRGGLGLAPGACEERRRVTEGTKRKMIVKLLPLSGTLNACVQV